MRYLILDESEAVERVAHEARIDAWWRGFEKNANRIDDVFSRRIEWDLGEWVAAQLKPLSGSSTIFFEFGPGRSGGHSLVLTADGTRHLRPLVAEIVRRAPKLPGWEFLSARPPVGIEEAFATAQARSGIDLTGLTAAAAAGEYGRIDVSFFAKKVDRSVERAAFGAALTLLGEEIVDAWIGVVDTKTGKSRPLADLLGEVSGLIEQRRNALPPAPWHQHAAKATWSLLNLKPQPAADWARQDDLFVGKTADLDFFKNTRSGTSFDSARYSRHGDIFCYLKTDGSVELDPTGFADKAEIEEALDAALVPDKLGINIGGGTGKRYSYVDLAITDLRRAIPALREAMQRGKLPRRSWILFWDDAYQQEWVGIWPDSPPPLLPPIDE